ncbi:MAG: hypothetical protein PVI75_02755 [Gammaproteobacteria bacterium]|jgi:hypothetical protein
MSNFATKFFPKLDDFLKKYEFVVQEDCYDEKNFGNSYLIAFNDVLTLRFVRDRAQYFVDVKLASEDKWHQLNDIFQVLNAKVPALDLQSILLSLDQNFQSICHLFSCKESLRKLIAFEQEKTEKWLGNK